MPHQSTLSSAIVVALETANPHEKPMQHGRLLPHGVPITLPNLAAPHRQIDRMACQTNALVARGVPRRRITAGSAGRTALLHAIAHIELNAIDLALDMTSRFVGQNLPKDFYNDWLGVADDESRHFLMLSDRLAQMGCGQW